MAGRTVSDIARVGFVSEATVRTQVRSVLSKLGVSSQLAAVGRAHDAKWRFDEGLEPAAGPA
jgi:DNA-binding NarL/FixJ family response regulator